MNHDEYSEIPGMNWSTLSKLATSPMLLKWRAEHPAPDTEAYQFGRAVHCAVLEPDEWRKRYAYGPKVDRRTKAGKAEWAAAVEAAGDAEILKSYEYDRVQTCAAAVRGHRVANSLLRGGRAEETATWTDAETGIECKGRLDYICPDCLTDLKSTRRQTVREIERDVAGFKYYAQIAWYLDGAIAAKKLPPDAEAFIVAVQTSEPYDVVAFRLTPATLDAGRGEYRNLLRLYVECKAANIWPGIAPDLINLELPDWAVSAAESPSNEGGSW